MYEYGAQLSPVKKKLPGVGLWGKLVGRHLGWCGFPVRVRGAVCGCGCGCGSRAGKLLPAHRGLEQTHFLLDGVFPEN